MEGHIGDQRSKAVMRYLDRLKKSVRRGASLSLANAPQAASWHSGRAEPRH